MDPNTEHHDHDEHMVWVSSEPTPQGGYGTTLSLGPDHIQFLTTEQATEHALACLSVAADASHDAAVFRQQMMLGVDLDLITDLVVRLRADRPLVAFPTALALRGNVTIKGAPFVIVVIDGQDVGQWDVPATEQHALAALQVAHRVTHLDEAYLRVLRGTVGLDDAVAVAAVGDLRRHRA